MEFGMGKGCIWGPSLGQFGVRNGVPGVPKWGPGEFPGNSFWGPEWGPGEFPGNWLGGRIVDTLHKIQLPGNSRGNKWGEKWGPGEFPGNCLGQFGGPIWAGWGPVWGHGLPKLGGPQIGHRLRPPSRTPNLLPKFHQPPTTHACVRLRLPTDPHL